jgi:hypothetical protein
VSGDCSVGRLLCSFTQAGSTQPRVHHADRDNAFQSFTRHRMRYRFLCHGFEWRPSDQLARSDRRLYGLLLFSSCARHGGDSGRDDRSHTMPHAITTLSACCAREWLMLWQQTNDTRWSAVPPRLILPPDPVSRCQIRGFSPSPLRPRQLSRPASMAAPCA